MSSLQAGFEGSGGLGAPEGELGRRFSGNFIVTGLPACGKSAIGRLAAQILGLGFIDLDQWIELSAGASVSEIFERYGEDGFREIETRAIGELQVVRNHVIAVGSGAVELPSNWDNLQKLGVIVYLVTPLEQLSKRIARSASELEKRPYFKDLISVESTPLRQESVKKRLGELYERRQSRFLGAEITVLNGLGTCEFVAQSLAREARKFWHRR